MSEKDIYSIVPEMPENDPHDKPEKKKKRLTRRQKHTLWVASCAAFSAAAVTVGIIFGLPLLKKSNNNVYSIADMPLMYVTDSAELKYYNYETKSDTLVASTLIDKSGAMPYVAWAVTTDGRSFFFADEYGDLYRNNLYTDRGNNFIAENVTSFSVTKDGNVLYLSGDGELIYVYFKSDKTEYASVSVDTGVSEFKCNTKKENAAYIKKTDARSFLYSASLSKKPKVSLISEDCGDFIDTDVADLTFLFTEKVEKDGKTTVYLTKSLKKTVIATDNADKIFSLGSDGSLIYGVSTGQVIDMNAYFTDEKASEDAEVSEPDYGEVLYGNISSAAFDNQMSVWMGKTSRDTIREIIGEKNALSGGYTLYKYKNGTVQAIDENVTGIIDTSSDNSSTVYAVTKYKTSNIKTVCDISDFKDVTEAEEKINELFHSGKVTYKIFTESGTVSKEIYTYEGKDVTVRLSDDMTGLYIFEKESGTLKYIDIALGNVGELRDVAADITNLSFSDGNVLYTQKDTKLKEVTGGTETEGETEETSALYKVVGIKSVKVGENADPEKVYISENYSYYITNDGKLIRRGGEEETEIADSASAIYWRGDDKVYYVSYNETNGYSLYIYNGAESHGIAIHLLYVLGM